MTNQTQGQYQGHPSRSGGISPPANFDEAADDYAKAVEARAATMSPERTGRTSQYPRSTPISDPSASIPAPPQPFMPARPAQSDVEFVDSSNRALAFSLNGLYEFFKNWAIAALFFSVMYLAPSATSNGIVAKLAAWSVTPGLAWSVFLALFLFGARKEMFSWGKALFFLAKSIVFEVIHLKLLLAWILAYIFASALLS